MSVVYQRVPARLQYGLQYMRGRQVVLGMRLPASARGRGGRSSGSGTFPIAHIDPAPQDVRVPQRWWIRPGASLVALRRRSIQDPGFGIPRIYLSRTRVNKGKRKGRGFDTPARWSSYRPLTAPLLADR